MSSIYWNTDTGTELEEVAAGSLGEMLRAITPHILGNRVELDTETSGLFVDGDWKDAPPARVSVVSLTWAQESTCTCGNSGYDPYGGTCGDCAGQSVYGGPTEIISVALPFDQGHIGGKPGKWSDELDGYEPLPHTPECHAAVMSGKCVCAPWNLNAEDWAALCEWLKDRRLVMHNAKYDLHIMRAGLRTIEHLGYCGVDLSSQTVWDTMTAQGIIEPLQSSSLKPTSERLFGESSRDEERIIKEALKKNGVGLTWRYDLLAWDVIGPYAAKDTKLTHMLFDWQQFQIENGQVGHIEIGLIASELELTKTLFAMECRRVGFDIERMREQTKLLMEAAADLANTLPFSPVNVNQAKAYFFGKEPGQLGITPIKVTDVCTKCTYNREKDAQRKNTKKMRCGEGKRYTALGGEMDPKEYHTWAPSLDGEVAARLASDGVPFADVWVQLAQIESALSKWYKAWPYKAVKTPEGWRLMTNFRQGRIESDRKGMTSGGAISGRLSAERIQLQGFPDDYKIPSFITPPKKLLQGKTAHCAYCDQITVHELNELDISNAEVRCAAWLMQSPSLAKACATGNVHSANTVMMAEALGMLASFPGGWPEGLPADAWWYDENGNVKLDDEGKRRYFLEQHPQWGMYRKIMKTTVLGLFFGAGLRTLRAQIEQATKKDFPESKVKYFRDTTLALIPEWKGVSNRMQRKADKSLGGVGYINLVNGRKRWFGWAEHTHKAFNAGTQGGIAEVMKVFMVWVDKTYPGVLVNQVHDSLWLEVCPCRSAQVLAEVKAEGVRLFSETFSSEKLPMKFELDSKRLA